MKKTKFTKLLCIALSLMMLFCTIPLSASAALEPTPPNYKILAKNFNVFGSFVFIDFGNDAKNYDTMYVLPTSDFEKWQTESNQFSTLAGMSWIIMKLSTVPSSANKLWLKASYQNATLNYGTIDKLPTGEIELGSQPYSQTYPAVLLPADPSTPTDYTIILAGSAATNYYAYTKNVATIGVGFDIGVSPEIKASENSSIPYTVAHSHSFNGEYVAGKGENAGKHGRRCTVATCFAIGGWENHTSPSYTPNNDATCTEDGTKTGKCSVCGGTDTITDVGTAKGHSFTSGIYSIVDSNTHSQKCVNCDVYSDPTAHTGMDDYICDNCGFDNLDGLKADAISALETAAGADASDAVSAIVAVGTTEINAAENADAVKALLELYTAKITAVAAIEEAAGSDTSYIGLIAESAIEAVSSAVTSDDVKAESEKALAAINALSNTEALKQAQEALAGAQEENDTLKTENTELKEENGKLKEENGKLEEENSKLEEENGKLKEENGKLEEANTNLTNELKDTKDALTTEQTNLQTADNTIAELKAQLAAKTKELAATKGELEKTNTELTGTKADLADANKTIEDLRAQLAAKDKDINLLNKTLAEREATIEELENSIGDLSKYSPLELLAIGIRSLLSVFFKNIFD